MRVDEWYIMIKVSIKKDVHVNKVIYNSLYYNFYHDAQKNYYDLEALNLQGMDVGGIFDPMYSTRDPPKGAFFWKSRPPYAMIDVRTVVYFLIVVVIVEIIAID